jgi:hypothetical protein
MWASAMLVLVPSSGWAGGFKITLDKDLVFADVPAGATMTAGGVVETWKGNMKRDRDVAVTKDGKVRAMYPSAVALENKAALFRSNGTDYGLPIGLAPGNVDTRAAGSDPAANLAFSASHFIFDFTDQSNNAEEELRIGLRNPNGQTIPVFDENNPKKPKMVALTNTVTAVMHGAAMAGTPVDSKFHSADAVTAVAIAGQTFVRPQSKQMMPFKALGKQQVFVERSAARLDDKAKAEDPYFLTVTDLTTGVSTTLLVMEEEVSTTNATVTINDSGIDLNVDLTDPTSSALLSFTNEFPGVQNPYTYQADLSPTGFSASGALSSGWTVTDSGGRRDAFFAYSSDGQPYNSADVVPSADLVSAGDMYSYEGGASEVAVDIKSVPEPSALFLCLVGAVAGCASKFLAMGIRGKRRN